jgi:hypothetical protein
MQQRSRGATVLDAFGVHFCCRRVNFCIAMRRDIDPYGSPSGDRQEAVSAMVPLPDGRSSGIGLNLTQRVVF